MQTFQGHLRKMQVKHDTVVQYALVLDDQVIDLNAYIGSDCVITHGGVIHCMACHQVTKKSYRQGYCFRCFQKLAACDLCIMKPELCHFAQGTCREPTWGLMHCMQPHVVYLAWSSGLKVGLTKPSQIPIRWIDQGAIQAVPILGVASRYHAGLVEDYLRQWYRDQTNWRKMLAGSEPPTIDLIEEARRAVGYVKDSDVLPKECYDGLVFPDLVLKHFNYPTPGVSGPIKSLSLDKQPVISGRLLGIKGQYLLLDSGVVNIRKHTSYLVDVSIA